MRSCLTRTRKPRGRIGPLALALVVLVGTALSSCLSPATSVLVIVDTDARTRVLSLRVLSSRGSAIGVHAEQQGWTQTGSTQDFTFPASFGVIPGSGPNDGNVTLEVDATFAPSVAGQPIVTVRRTARFRFLPHVATVIRLFIPLSCAGDVSPPSHCTQTTMPCTVSEFCIEQTPTLTCGDDGRCVSLDVTPVPLDGGTPVSDAQPDVASDITNDATTEACVPACAGRTCGDDHCGGTCGSCGSGQICDSSGHCALTCTPSCTGRVCGSDGCSGTCGMCPAGQTCSAMGTCACVPNCAGRVCGSDGCGATCGMCPGGSTCNAAGQCVTSCTPNCTGRTCGTDGCTGTCGSCGSAMMCNAAGQCVCAPNCVGHACGADGCGGSCGTCSAGTVCNGSGACIACSTGMSCSPATPCTVGVIDCSTGAPVCSVSGNASVGTSCPGGVCNSSGSCVPCVQGQACTPASECVTAGTIDCSTGAPVCTPSLFAPRFTPCTSGFDGSQCDGSGNCQCLGTSGCNRCGICNYPCATPC